MEMSGGTTLGSPSFQPAMAMQLGGWTAYPLRYGLLTMIAVALLYAAGPLHAAGKRTAKQPALEDIPLADVPVPEPRPGPEPVDKLLPDDGVPIPLPRPEPPSAKKNGGPKDIGKGVADDRKPPPDEPPKDDLTPPPRPATMPAEELACRARLKELGVVFKEMPQLADKAGCSVEWPIEVSSLGAVKLSPPGVFNCAVTERSAKFMRDTVVPKSRSILGSEVTTIRQASAYVCRPRNGTSKLSEHAFGNALDIDSFELADKRSLSVGRVTKPVEAQFMLAVRLAACGPYTTVLGPGSNADHATHFHFDLAKRRPGSTYCK